LNNQLKILEKKSVESLGNFYYNTFFYNENLDLNAEN
jgi:hypothetical protein